jgi:hypothetical protein
VWKHRGRKACPFPLLLSATNAIVFQLKLSVTASGCTTASASATVMLKSCCSPVESSSRGVTIIGTETNDKPGFTGMQVRLRCISPRFPALLQGICSENVRWNALSTKELRLSVCFCMDDCHSPLTHGSCPASVRFMHGVLSKPVCVRQMSLSADLKWGSPRFTQRRMLVC